MKQYIYRSSRVLSAVAFVILVLTGCGRHNNKITTVNPIITGAAHMLPIAAANNAVVTDATNGLVFVFPSGGIGTMTVAPITDAPARSLPGGQGYQTRFNTNTPISLRYPVPASGEQLVYYFTDAVGCYDGADRPDKEWLALPVRNPGDGYLYFDLPRTPKASVRQGIIDEVVDIFWSITVDPPANAQTLRGYVTAAQTACVTALPESLQAGVLQREAARGGTVYFRSPGMGSFYFYTAMYGASIYLRTDVDQTTAVHEAAHYMTHMLMTDDQWMNLQRNARQVHGIGEVYTRNNALTDDYAYYLQSLMGYQSVTVTNASTLFSNTLRPSIVDVPSVEGFAATLLGYLTINNVPLGGYTDFAKTKSYLPIYNLTPGEGVMPFRTGPLTITDLYPQIENYIIANGFPREAVAVTAERAGWSYNGKGTLTANGAPAKGATIQSVITYKHAGLTRSFTTPIATADSKGEYTLPRIFFGDILLRIAYGGRTIDYPYTVDRSKPTNTTLTLPTIDIGDTKRPNLISVEPNTAMADDTVTLIGDNFGNKIPLGGRVYIAPMPYISGNIIEPEIVSWTNTEVKIIIPPGINVPTQINISTGAYSAAKSCWLYLGNGASWLTKMKSYSDVRVAYIHSMIAPFNSVNGYSDIIGLSSQYLTHNYPELTYTHKVDWNGPTFTASYHVSGNINDPDFGSIGPVKENITITGTLDPVRRKLVNVTADMYQESYAYLEHDDGTPNTLTVQLKLKEMTGSDMDSQGYTVFGRYQGMDYGYPPVALTRNNVVSYHYKRTGDNPQEYFTDNFYQDPIWMSQIEMYVQFTNQ